MNSGCVIQWTGCWSLTRNIEKWYLFGICLVLFGICFVFIWYLSRIYLVFVLYSFGIRLVFLMSVIFIWKSHRFHFVKQKQNISLFSASVRKALDLVWCGGRAFCRHLLFIVGNLSLKI